MSPKWRNAQANLGLSFAGNHQKVQWVLPPWKPCEAGLGPPEFYGVPLDAAAAGKRAEQGSRNPGSDLRRSFAALRMEIVFKCSGPHAPRPSPFGRWPPPANIGHALLRQ